MGPCNDALRGSGAGGCVKRRDRSEIGNYPGAIRPGPGRIPPHRSFLFIIIIQDIYWSNTPVRTLANWPTVLKVVHMPPLDEPEAVLSHASKERHEAQRNKRREYYLKGPVSFGWIQDNIPDPTSRVILVARAFMDMDGSCECVLSKKIRECAGTTDRYQWRRVLGRIRKPGGNYRVIDRTGRPSVIQLINYGNAAEEVT